MRRWGWVLLLALAAACTAGGASTPPEHDVGPAPAGPSELRSTPKVASPEPAPRCRPPDGSGTVSPNLSITSITFMVNGVEQVIAPGGAVAASPGDRVRLAGATLCSEPYSGDPGAACVDVAPLDEDGEEVQAEHLGTHMVPVSPGSIHLRGPAGGWTVEEGWTGFSVVLNHWPPVNTRDQACAASGCERDDQVMIAIEP